MTTTQDLQAFLSDHGLEQYLDVMLAEDIDLDTLRELDDADLKELGLSMGHRKTLRKALDAAGGNGDARVRDEERRQVTIFFCDLVGSTELAGRYDAEDMADILSRYHTFAEGIITSMGGINLGTQGDGIVACFGYPKAAENDAERAVTAALAISDGVPKLGFDDGLVLHTRIGVATGRVFVSGHAADSSALVGDTLNLASRLQDSAPTDRVVTGQNTRALIERSAEMTFLDARALKGFAGDVDIWVVDGLKDHADRALTVNLTGDGLLGREQEFATLRDLWAQAKGGAGQVLVISGEAGIGKSHLLAAARAMALADGSQVVRYFCASGYENSALYPVRRHIARTAGLTDGMPSAEVADYLSAYAGTQDVSVLRLLADLVSLEPGAKVPPLDMTAAQQKQATFALLTGQLRATAEAGPVMVLLEDVHWADPSTLELLAGFVTAGVADLPILIIATHRPQTQLHWGELDFVTYMSLDRLSADESRQLVTRIMGDTRCPADLMHRIVETADGVPLFVEELSRSVLEQVEHHPGGFAAVTVPITLEDSLMARLDRLSRGKPVVQTAAMFGRRFETPAVQEVVGLAPPPFQSALAEAVEARILLPDSKDKEEAMLFRHALVQQAAYEGIAKKQRQQLHAKIAALLMEHQPTLATSEPETLARHHAGAGQYAEAIQFLIAAGQKATSRAAQIEASNYYFEALAHLENLPAGRERDETEVLLRALLGAALMATRGFAAPEVYDAFARARELCLSLGDSPMYCSCLFGLFTVEASRSNKDAALALAEEMYATFGNVPVPSWVVAANFTIGVARFFEGNMDAAETHFDAAIAGYTADQHQPMMEQFADDLGEYSICYRHWVYMLRGDIPKSTEMLDRAEKLANEVNNKAAQTRSIAFHMGRSMEFGDVAAVAEAAPKLIELASTQGYPYWACVGQIALGWAISCGGQADGLAPIVGSLQFFDMIGQRNPQTHWRTYLINAHVHLGQKTEALEAAALALEMSRGGLDSAFEPMILLRRGEAELLDPADPKAAEARFREAMAVADRTGVHFPAFLAALALAEFLIAEGRTGEEGGVLAAAFARIRFEKDMALATRARGVLDQL